VSVVEAVVVREHLDALRAGIAEAAARAGRRPEEVEILAAVKYVGRDDLPALRDAGVTLVGENRTDALLSKQAGFEDAFTWDFIGHLQSRKARDVAGRVRLVHALESESTARQLDARATAPQEVLVEVNAADDPSKYGVATADLDRFLDVLAGLERIRVRGLMTMPAFTEDPEGSRAAFARLRALAAECAARYAGRHAFDVLSMGTSQDFLVAVEEGATIVRVGSVLYGRPLA
jgi:pyridoxal phosphate enzyme (YggS family)